MPVKDAIRTYTCKYCGKKFTMFRDSKGEIIFFPENTVRAAYGKYELNAHIKEEHTVVFNLYSWLTEPFKNLVEDCYNVQPV